jgi:hypothetical protein
MASNLERYYVVGNAEELDEARRIASKHFPEVTYVIEGIGILEVLVTQEQKETMLKAGLDVLTGDEAYKLLTGEEKREVTWNAEKKSIASKASASTKKS